MSQMNPIEVFHNTAYGADLNSEFLQDLVAPITKKNVLSVACQFCNPTGLATPLMSSILSALSTPHFPIGTNRLRYDVNKILLTRNMSFPCQIIFNYSAQLFIFFDGSLQGYGACVQHSQMVSSTLFPGQPRYQRNLHLRLQELFWPPEDQPGTV